MRPFWPDISAAIDQSNEASQLFEAHRRTGFKNGLSLFRLRLNPFLGCCVAKAFTLRLCPEGLSWIDLKSCMSEFGKDLLNFSEVVSKFALINDQKVINVTSNKLWFMKEIVHLFLENVWCTCQSLWESQTLALGPRHNDCAHFACLFV